MGKTTTKTTYSLPDGEPTELRPDSDTVLTLKNSSYRQTMENFYRRLGTKKSNDESNDLTSEKNTAREALNLFKNRGKGAKARFFLAADRYSRESFVEVDENAALKSECTYHVSYVPNVASSIELNIRIPATLQRSPPTSIGGWRTPSDG